MTKDDEKKIEYTKKKIAKAKADFENMKAGCAKIDKEKFDFLMPDIENTFIELDIIMDGFVYQVERTYALEEYDWYYATEHECSYYVSEDIKDGRRSVNRSLRKIKNFFDECKL